MTSQPALPPWRPLLRGAREREGRQPQARWLQLATVATDGTPRIRTLVFRGWAGAPFPSELTDDLPIPEHFQLLRIALTQVELLELSDHPHRRRRWCQGDGWREHGLNP